MCSGIGAPEVAAPWVDWRLASEIEKFPREVLKQRFGYAEPEAHNQGEPLLWGDMTEIDPELLKRRGIPLPDLIVAGTPCQAFSVAGLRKGTDDDRGNLTLKFVEIVHAIVDARPDGKLAVLWENVPGVLSDKGNAFGSFLGGLVGSLDALPPPGDGSWPGEGMVQGPRARAAWAVLDAQHFGLAQRRRRVFVVVDFGNCIDPAQILLEPESLRGNSAPRREAGKGVAGTLSARSEGGGGLGTDFELGGGLTTTFGSAGHSGFTEGVGTDRAEGGDCGGGSETLAVQGHHGSIAGTVSAKWVKGSGGPAGDETQNMIAYAIQERAVSENPDAGPDGAGYRSDAAYTLEARSVPQAVAFAENSRGEVRLQGGDGQISPQLTTGGGKPGQGQPCIAFDCKGTEVQHDASGVSPPLRSMGHLNSHTNGGGHAAVAFKPSHFTRGKDGAPSDVTPPLSAEADKGDQDPVVAFDLRGREGGAMPEGPHDTASIRAASGGSSRSYQVTPSVRRLMPLECARLQGFSDDHCAITYRNKPAADGPQYKAYGNSMAVPVVAWILNRVRISYEHAN